MIRWICFKYTSIDPFWTSIFGFWGCRWMARMIHFAALLPIVSIINKESYKHPFPPPTKTWNEKQYLSDLRGNVVKITYSYYTELCYVSYMLYSIVFDHTVLQYILSNCVIEHRPVYSMILDEMWYISLWHIYTVHSFDFLPGMRLLIETPYATLQA